MNTKICTICKEKKELNKFHSDPKKRLGVSQRCGACSSKMVKKIRDLKRKDPTWVAQERLRSRSKLFKCRYGITLEAYDQLAKSQDNLCKICSKLPKNGRYLVVDHCHKTGKIRGLLCDGCNVAIAILDNKGLLDKALTYLNVTI
jgi:hypothetical protein